MGCPACSTGSCAVACPALKAELEVVLWPTCRLNWKLVGLKKREDGNVQLTYDTPQGQKQVVTRTVALTAPAYVAADLLEANSAAAAAALRQLDYPPVAAVTLAYPLTAIRQDRLASGALPGAPSCRWRLQECRAASARGAARVFMLDRLRSC